MLYIVGGNSSTAHSGRNLIVGERYTFETVDLEPPHDIHHWTGTYIGLRQGDHLIFRIGLTLYAFDRKDNIKFYLY